MKTALILLFCALIGYGSGLLLEAVAEGEDSKLLRLTSAGIFDQDWIPFLLDAQMSKINDLKRSMGLEALVLPNILQAGELHDQAVPIEKANISFNIGVVKTIIDGKPLLQNVVDKCYFHSDESFGPMCVICKILDKDGNVVGAGMVKDDNKNYKASETVEIKLTPVNPNPRNGDDDDDNGKHHDDDDNGKHDDDDDKDDYRKYFNNDDFKKYFSKDDFKKFFNSNEFKKYSNNNHGSDKEHEEKPSHEPPPTCSQEPIVTTNVLGNGDVVVTYKQSRNLNDNSYGVNAVGWGTKGHTFKALINSDNLQVQFKKSNGQVVLDFYLDYLTATSSNGISGYASLGPDGGDGSMVSGSRSNILSWSTSLDENLNNHGYFAGGTQVVGFGTANLLIDSPPTVSSTSYQLPVGSPFPDWDFTDTYTVTISNNAFPGGFVAGGYSVNFPSVHNSPPKKCLPSDGDHDGGLPNDVQNVEGVKVVLCSPPSKCECKKPDKFIVRYNGPDGVKVEIYKNENEVGQSSKRLATLGPFNNGALIVLDSNLHLGQSTVNSNTVYNFVKNYKSIGVVKIHTSCSQPLFVGQMFFFHQGQSDQIKLTVVSGTLKGVPSIPDKSCPVPPPKCECKDRKEDHKKRYDDYKKDYDNNKKYYSKGDYKKYLDNFKKYFDDNKKYFDKDDYKKYMDFYKKYLDDNKKYFDSGDYKKYSDDYKKYSDDYKKHNDNGKDDDDDDKCECKDDDDDDNGKHDDKNGKDNDKGKNDDKNECKGIKNLKLKYNGYYSNVKIDVYKGNQKYNEFSKLGNNGEITVTKKDDKLNENLTFKIYYDGKQQDEIKMDASCSKIKDLGYSYKGSKGYGLTITKMEKDYSR